MRKLLDLFACAGGAGEGYRRAGFDVYAVDLFDRPRNPFPFYKGDALAALDWMISGGRIEFGNGDRLGLDDFDAIHASPPCQAYSVTKSKSRNRKTTHVDLVGPVRERLQKTGKPWVIENVVGAPLIGPIVLCGTQFGLVANDVDGAPLRLLRHRLFESNTAIVSPDHRPHSNFPGITASVFGSGGTYTPAHRDNRLRQGGYVPHISVIREIMGIDWMGRYELSQSIPPAYTEYVGRQLLDPVERLVDI